MQKYEVIICGAGISGLSAGIGLIQKGLDPEKFLILESEVDVEEMLSQDE